MSEPKPPMSAQKVQAYKDATDNLIYLKKEQLRIVYYTILALAAVYALAKASNATENLKAFFIFCSFAVTLFSVFWVWQFQISMRKFRTRLVGLYAESFTDEERTVLRLEATKDEVRSSD
jgi:hypothetical protein